MDLNYVQDEMNNVVIYKPASKGYENAPTVILQGHMDMVCEKRPGVEHDFEKDGLNLSVRRRIISVQTEPRLAEMTELPLHMRLALLDSTDLRAPGTGGI